MGEVADGSILIGEWMGEVAWCGDGEGAECSTGMGDGIGVGYCGGVGVPWFKLLCCSC